MNENNRFILKPEMYNQEEWYKMFMKSIETINNLHSKIDKANNYIDNERKKIQQHQYSIGIRRLNKIQDILKEVNCDEVKQKILL